MLFQFSNFQLFSIWYSVKLQLYHAVNWAKTTSFWAFFLNKLKKKKLRVNSLRDDITEAMVSKTHPVCTLYEIATNLCMCLCVCMWILFLFVAKEGQVELQEAVKLRSKRDRESLMNNQSKRKRINFKWEEGEEEDEEYSTVVVDENNHCRPARSSRHWKVANEMIGVSVPRKAYCCKNLNLPNTSLFFIHNIVFEKKKKRIFSEKSTREFG